MNTIPQGQFNPAGLESPGTVIAVPGQSPPYAAWFRQADASHLLLLHAGQPDYCIACDLPDGVGNALDLRFSVRPFCDRAWAAVVATGTGTVYIGAYEIAVNAGVGSTLANAAVFVGSQTNAGMMTVTPTAAGVPTMHAVTNVYRSTGVTVFSLSIFGRRSTAAL